MPLDDMKKAVAERMKRKMGKEKMKPTPMKCMDDTPKKKR